MDVEQGFHQEMLRICEETNKFGYNPTYFLRMVLDHGGIDAARRLLQGNEISYGLMRLWKEGRLDISMEALVLQEPWSSLFTEAELRVAKQRLTDLGYAFSTTAV